MTKANLQDAILVEADISALLDEANFTNADLSRSSFNGFELEGTSFYNANFQQADISRVSFKGTNLSKVNFQYAKLDGVFFSNAELSLAKLGATTLTDTNFCDAKGLTSIIHEYPSSISTDTLLRSKGTIPEIFLRGCGLSDWEIEAARLYNPELTNEERNRILYKIYDLQASQAIQISPLFISYSHRDSAFVDRIEKSLSEMGIRFWRDVHNMKSGRIEKQIDRAIRQNPIVLVVLSENSINSDWVQHEVRLGRKLEQEIGRDVLCPVRLDDSFFSSSWPEHIKEQVMEYIILDFSKWEDDGKFNEMFTKLIDGLNLFYTKDNSK